MPARFLICHMGIIWGAAHFLLAGPTSWAQERQFEKDILPILREHCWKCHGEEKTKGKLDLRTLPAMLKGGAGSAGVVPGSLRGSGVWAKVTMDFMPPGDVKLPDKDKAVLRDWILHGNFAGRTAPDIAPSMPLAKVDPLAVARAIDVDIDRRLAQAKVPASPLADDAAFLRRVYLDITGRIPTVEQAAAYMSSNDPNRRKQLIDSLLDRPEYGENFAYLWNSLLVAPTAASARPHDSALIAWLTEQFNRGHGWGQTVTGLLTASSTGGKSAVGPSPALFVSNPEAKLMSRASALRFLGIRLECAECHNHPESKWTQKDFWGLAAFFARMSTKKGVVAEDGKVKDKTAIGGAKILIPSSSLRLGGQVMPARFLDGESPDLGGDGPYRPAFAKWLTSPENPYFARAAVNRLWHHFFARGLVHPVDDLDDSNPPSHPEVLDLLAMSFTASKFDIKHAIRCICNTQAYQRSSQTVAGNEDDKTLMSHMRVKMIQPEALCASLEIAVGPVVAGPKGKGKSGGNRNQFATAFAPPSEEPDLDEYTHTVLQAMRVINDPLYNQGGFRASLLAKSNPDSAKAVDQLFLAVLSRRPSDAESRRMTAFVERQPSRAEGYAGVFWVLVNSSEFVLNR